MKGYFSILLVVLLLTTAAFAHPFSALENEASARERREVGGGGWDVYNRGGWGGYGYGYGYGYRPPWVNRGYYGPPGFLLGATQNGR
uniref:Uncharacterized protein n=1 Tax=Steinernema glaseri TaxID=37863 RepID=A0A1I7XVT6_9BILA